MQGARREQGRNSNLAESKEKLCYESHDEGKGWEEMVN